MSASKRGLAPEELALWRKVAAGVAPQRRRAEHDITDLIETDVIALGAGVVAPPTRHGSGASAPKTRAQAPSGPVLDRGGEKHVRRGKIEIEAALDLHGCTQQAARAALGQFLAHARAQGLRLVLVITGKGATGEGALKRALPLWLEAHDLRPLLSGYAQAHRRHGGTGAFYIFLRRA